MAAQRPWSSDDRQSNVEGLKVGESTVVGTVNVISLHTALELAERFEQR